MFCPMNFSNSEIFTESTILRNLFLVPHYLPLAICLLLIFWAQSFKSLPT
jgi:hypothetical protein